MDHQAIIDHILANPDITHLTLDDKIDMCGLLSLARAHNLVLDYNTPRYIKVIARELPEPPTDPDLVNLAGGKIVWAAPRWRWPTVKARLEWLEPSDWLVTKYERPPTLVRTRIKQCATLPDNYLVTARNNFMIIERTD